MKVLMIARSTLYTVKGGDTVQFLQTKNHLIQAGIEVDSRLSSEKMEYEKYDLLHFFNITRPADIIKHIHKSNKPYVVSTIFVEYKEYDKKYRKGTAASLFRFLSGDGIEYAKTLRRWCSGKDNLVSKSYLWRGQYRSVKYVLENAALLLPNSHSESGRLIQAYRCRTPFSVVTNGIDPGIFHYNKNERKDTSLVICAARIEGIKNQLNLIRALNNTHFRLLIIGAASPGQAGYYEECRRIAAENVVFIDALPQNELAVYYQQAKVHVLPSWFETTGLSSLEAAAMGCNIVISNRGDAPEYFGNHAFYCDPRSPESIYRAVCLASSSGTSEKLIELINESYTWKQATAQTLEAYYKVINEKS